MVDVQLGLGQAGDERGEEAHPAQSVSGRSRQCQPATDSRVSRVNDRLVWIDCEMTGLDLRADALIEVAALVTDFELNVLGDGRRPDREAARRGARADGPTSSATMHETSGLLAELDKGLTLGEAEEQVLAYIHEHCGENSRPPLAGNSVATDRAFLARDMPDLESFLHYRIVDVSSIKELVTPVVPAGLLPAPRPSAATTGRWPTSRRASRSCATTGRPSSCRPPGPTATRARSIAARHGGSLTGKPGTAPPDAETHGLTRLHFSPVPVTVRSLMVGVAQLVEHRVVVARVAGSSPVTHPSHG